MSYETLDLIADSYTPLLLLFVCWSIVHVLLSGQRSLAGHYLLALFAGVVIVYGLMFIDNAIGIWPAMGMDYSTHSAAALVLVVFLFWFKRPARLFWPVSFCCYVLLMRYQQYHTWEDIVTTVVVVGTIYHFLLRRLSRQSAS